jgi:C-terminal processing protease CtpA/Prc
MNIRVQSPFALASFAIGALRAAMVYTIICAIAFGVSSCQLPTNPPAQRDASAEAVLYRNGILSNNNVNPEPFGLDIKEFVHVVMRDLYLWNSTVPENGNLQRYSTPQQVMTAFRNPEDRFSALIEDGQSYINLLFQGDESTFGLGVKSRADTALFIAQVDAGSPADEAGLRRGMRVVALNGFPFTRFLERTASVDAFPNPLSVTVRSGDTNRTVTITRRVVSLKFVNHTSVFQAGGRRVGYLVFSAFLGKADEELNIAFARFKDQGVNELILDLRYNGGGLLSIAQNLASHIAPQLAGTVLTRLRYNDRYLKNNRTLNIESRINGLNLQRLVVITSGNTASASELLINGLLPHINVVTVGSRTIGKNVGSNTTATFHQRSGYLFIPISFGFENSRGERNFGNGFSPNIPAVDDVTKSWGDPTEASLAAALRFIERGALPKLSAREEAEIAAESSRTLLPVGKSYREFMPVFDVQQP